MLRPLLLTVSVGSDNVIMTSFENTINLKYIITRFMFDAFASVGLEKQQNATQHSIYCGRKKHREATY